MKKKTRNLLTILAAIAFLFPGAAVQSVQPQGQDTVSEKILENGNWSEVSAEAEEGPKRKFTTTVPAEVTMVTLPEGFLAEGTEFKFEILAIEESGIQTITESCFETEED